MLRYSSHRNRCIKAWPCRFLRVDLFALTACHHLRWSVSILHKSNLSIRATTNPSRFVLIGSIASNDISCTPPRCVLFCSWFYTTPSSSSSSSTSPPRSITQHALPLPTFFDADHAFPSSPSNKLLSELALTTISTVSHPLPNSHPTRNRATYLSAPPLSVQTSHH